MIYLLTNKNIIIPTVLTNIQSKKTQFSRPRKRQGSFTDWIHQKQPVFLGVAHLSLCIITYCSISTVKVLVRLASSFFFFFYVFFSSSRFASSSYSLQPPTDFLNPPTKSFLFSSFSGEHQQTVLGLSTGHQLRNLRLHHRLTVWLLWETICRIPPPWLWHFELSVDGKGADCLLEEMRNATEQLKFLDHPFTSRFNMHIPFYPGFVYFRIPADQDIPLPPIRPVWDH